MRSLGGLKSWDIESEIDMDFFWHESTNQLVGEYTPFMIIGYFGLTTFLTAFAFGSYLILTKLKIIWELRAVSFEGRET